MQKTILLVEDEEQVRVLLERVLSKHNFIVLTAANGREALGIARQQIDDIALVVSDVIMPELGGAGLLRELQAMRPETPVLLMTGYSDEHIEKEGSLEGAHLIQKPFTPQQFMSCVNDILANAAASN